MEEFRRGLAVFLTVLASIAAVIIAAILVFRFLRMRKMNELMHAPKRDFEFVRGLLRYSFLPVCVAGPVSFPILTADGMRALTAPCMIAVGRGGVAVTEVMPLCGNIDNPFHGDWTKTDSEKPFVFRNPFEKNMTNVRAVERIIKRSGQANVPIHNIVLATGRRVRFTHDFERLVKPLTAGEYFSDMNKNKFLSFTEMLRVSDALKKCGRPAARGAAVPRKNSVEVADVPRISAGASRALPDAGTRRGTRTATRVPNMSHTTDSQNTGVSTPRRNRVCDLVDQI